LEFCENRLASALSRPSIPESVRSLLVVSADDSPDGIRGSSDNERRLGGTECVSLACHEMEDMPSFSFQNIFTGTVSVADFCWRETADDVHAMRGHGRHDMAYP